MNTASTESSLVLVIDNPEALQHGTAPRHSFTPAGGSIGAQDADWLLRDRAGRIQPLHCEIRFEDGGYFVIDRSDQTLLNGQTRPLGQSASARLRNADVLHLGPYRISVHLGEEAHRLPDASRVLAQHGVEELLHRPDDYQDALPIAADAEALHPAAPSPDWAAFQVLAEPLSPQGELDPLRALDLAGQWSASARPDVHSLAGHGAAPLAAQADMAATSLEAVYGHPLYVSGETAMSGKNHHSTATQEWLQAQQTHGGNPASLVAPLVEGLGAQVGALDAARAHDLLHEAGQCLAAAIRGLAAVHATELGAPGARASAARTLQPIEDNPLRLGQGFDDTVRAMFSAERSLVHLSPSAAIEESLQQIQLQQRASGKAIAAGLTALLAAFSPQQLERRFSRYVPAHQRQQTSDGWAWEMYGHYYNEMISGRQRGFDKLFWEVFEQAYDQALRAEEQ